MTYLNFTLYPAFHKTKKNGMQIRKAGGRTYIGQSALTVAAERDLHNLCLAEMLSRSAPGPTEMPLIIDLVFVFAIPKSRKKELKPGDPRMETPDTSNLVSMAHDAFEGVLYANDKQICGGSAVKIWGERVELQVTLRGWYA